MVWPAFWSTHASTSCHNCLNLKTGSLQEPMSVWDKGTFSQLSSFADCVVQLSSLPLENLAISHFFISLCPAHIELIELCILTAKTHLQVNAWNKSVLCPLLFGLTANLVAIMNVHLRTETLQKHSFPQKEHFSNFSKQSCPGTADIETSTESAKAGEVALIRDGTFFIESQSKSMNHPFRPFGLSSHFFTTEFCWIEFSNLQVEKNMQLWPDKVWS